MVLKIRDPETHPRPIVESLFEEALKTSTSPVRFCARVLPVDLVCRTSEEDFFHHTEAPLKALAEEQKDPFTVCLVECSGVSNSKPGVIVICNARLCSSTYL